MPPLSHFAGRVRVGLCTALGLAALLSVLLVLNPCASRAATRSATPADLSSVFSAAQPGDVIELAPGDYGTFRGGSKSGLVTLAPAAGAAPVISPQLDGAANIRFQGLSIGSTSVRASQNVQFVGNRFVGMTVVDASRNTPGSGILFDGNSFLGIDMCSTCYEGRLTVRGSDNTQPVGVTISRNHFGGGGESDGLQIVGGAYGVQVVGNEFDHIVQGDYSAHVDPLQLYGSSHTVIAGNWFHDNETNIMAPDGTDHEDIENNLFGARTGGYPWPIVLGSDVGSTVAHNTLVDGDCEFNLRCGILRIYDGNKGVDSRDTVVRDNIVTQLAVTDGAQLAVEDHNLVARGRGRGAHDLSGAPHYAGGGASRADFLLARGSLGTGAASDGGDVGILPDSASSPSPTPPAAPPGSGAKAHRHGPPAVALVRPHAGHVLGRTLHLAARAHDDSGIAGVAFWVGHKRVATVRQAPYRSTRQLTRRHRHRAHVVVARAFARDGQASSAAVSVGRHVRRWHILTRPKGKRTRVTGHGPRHRRLMIRLTRCHGGADHVVRRLRVRSGRYGRLPARTVHRGLCVADLRPVVR